MGHVRRSWPSRSKWRQSPGAILACSFRDWNLEDDAALKIGKLLADHGIVYYGRMPFDKPIAGRSDAEDLKCKAFNLVSTSLESHFRKANNQIKATAEEYGLQSSLGLVIVVNKSSGRNIRVRVHRHTWHLRRPPLFPVYTVLACASSAQSLIYSATLIT